jgi:hypothetical protein
MDCCDREPVRLGGAGASPHRMVERQRLGLHGQHPGLCPECRSGSLHNAGSVPRAQRDGGSIYQDVRGGLCVLPLPGQRPDCPGATPRLVHGLQRGPPAQGAENTLAPGVQKVLKCHSEVSVVIGATPLAFVGMDNTGGIRFGENRHPGFTTPPNGFQYRVPKFSLSNLCIGRVFRTSLYTRFPVSACAPQFSRNYSRGCKETFSGQLQELTKTAAISLFPWSIMFIPPFERGLLCSSYFYNRGPLRGAEHSNIGQDIQFSRIPGDPGTFRSGIHQI